MEMSEWLQAVAIALIGGFLWSIERHLAQLVKLVERHIDETRN